MKSLTAQLDGMASLADVLAWLKAAPAGTMVSATALADTLACYIDHPSLQPLALVNDGAEAPTWRERLWVVPGETRLTVPEVAEAIGRSKNFVYRHTSGRNGLSVIPHTKLGSILVFRAEEVRAWIADQESLVSLPGTV